MNPPNNQRRKFLYANQYQRQIVALAFYPSLIIGIIISLLLIQFFKDLVEIIIYGTSRPQIALIMEWAMFVLACLWVPILAVIFIAHSASKNLVGAFGRILRELDEVIEGKKRTPIKARAKDDLANDLLKRINALIEKLPK